MGIFRRLDEWHKRTFPPHQHCWHIREKQQGALNDGRHYTKARICCECGREEGYTWKYSDVEGHGRYLQEKRKPVWSLIDNLSYSTCDVDVEDEAQKH